MNIYIDIFLFPFVVGIFLIVSGIVCLSFIPIITAILFFLIPQNTTSKQKLKLYGFCLGIPLIIFSSIVFSQSLLSYQTFYAYSILSVDVATICGLINRYIILSFKTNDQLSHTFGERTASAFAEQEFNIIKFTFSGLTMTMFIAMVFSFFA